MAFCEQCGAELTPDSRFCEECGCAVEQIAEGAASQDIVSSSSELKEIFIEQDWKAKWARSASEASNLELGLILTREEELLHQINADILRFQELIADYISKCAKRGVKYHYVNLDKFPGYKGSGDVASVVSVLKEMVDVARPKYIFILGNEDVIDVTVVPFNRNELV